MKITYREYTLRQDVIAVERFNLSRVITAIATQDLKSGVKEGEEYQKEEELGYGYTLENAIQKIIAFELIKNDSTVDLKAFLRAYKEIKEDILTTLS